MPMSVSLNPEPQEAGYDPLGRAMTDEQRQRLREQSSTPIEETPAKEKVVDRRREDSRQQPGEEQPDDGEERRPGRIIDSFA